MLVIRQLTRIERGEINTSIISLLRIAKVLKVDIQQLFIFLIKEEIDNSKTIHF
jgi:transcriptional regulator with XRE-family HTH domain